MAEDFQANNWWKSASSSTSAATSSRHPMEQLSGGGSPLSSPPIDWAPATLLGRAESSFQALLQEDLNSRDINHPFFFDNNLILDMNYQKQQSADMLDSHLHFTNNTLFWNASDSSQPFDLPLKNLDGGRERKGGSEAPLKKIRVEATPSPLPAFKVRKEKLGDRITALQQLVSPFGKTDTASVLHEAIEYIKFLHDQVSVLSTPYLKNGQSMQQQQQSSEKNKREGEGQKQDLRSRGLCLVPISSTYPVASETTADFWTPTFGGTYR